MKTKVASQVVMIEPRSFCSNPETAASNAFQNLDQALGRKQILQKAQEEFLFFQNTLREKGIQVLSFIEDETQNTPDAIFPNNWFCHLPNGKAVVFPMFAENRQREIRADVLESLGAKSILDLSTLTQQKEFLEGTGSLILDHTNHVAYACHSPRTTQQALQIFSEKVGYRVQAFSAVDGNGQPIYHTNVMMALGISTAVVVLESIQNPIEKEALIDSLTKAGKTIVDISFQQMKNFVGNMLLLKNKNDQHFWICSSQAFKNLTIENKKILEADGEFLFAPLETIETYGGGGARCLLAEVF
ncbi:amidinotransferase [Bdellovibrio sp. qaytius]|nr:amidinotransferase [Bdellovibrio sp. qaytius]